MKRLLIGVVIVTMTFHLASAQFVIRPGTNIAFAGTPEIAIEMSGNVTTNNAADFSNANLHLSLGGVDLALSGAIVVRVLKLNSIGTKTVNNDLTVTEAIDFSSGVLVPSASAKILFTGEASSITGGNNASYVDGLFYQTGGGHRFYPLGTNDTFYPATFISSGNTDEVAIQVVAQDPLLTFNADQVLSIDNSHYWEIQAANPSAISSQVSLGLSGQTPPSEGSFAVLQAPSTASEATSLGFSTIDDIQVTSRLGVTSPILVVGTIPEIVVKVHDLITPYMKDEVNDKLYIEQIEAFDLRTVTMLDRWGVVVERWENYTNDIIYDFSKLSPGNYIVVVEFGNRTEGSTVEKISQMVTVLKTN